MNKKSELIQLLDECDFNYNKITHSYPNVLIMSLTNRCNLRCKYCFHTQSNKDMNLETAIQSVRYVLSNCYITGKRPTVIFFGGEPLLMFHEIIKPLVEMFQGTDIEWSITTNGTLLNEDIVDFFYNYNIPVLLSIDGCQSVQDEQRPFEGGKGSFNTILGQIPYLLLRFPNSNFRMTLTQHGVQYLEESYQTAKQLGFKYITIVPNAYEQFSEEDGMKIQAFYDRRGIELLENFVQFKMPEILVTNLLQGFNAIYDMNNNARLLSPPPHACGLGVTGIGVSPEGFLHPCQETNGNHSKDAVGNIRDGIDFAAHELFLKKAFSDYQLYVQEVDKLRVTPMFKLFLANGFCMTRVSSDLGLASSTIKTSQAVFKTASRIFMSSRNSLNPITDYILNGGQI